MVDFILNQASEEELRVLEAALARRARTRGPEDASKIEFGNMAEEITRGIQKRYAMPGKEHIMSMTRSMVKSIIQTHEPDISPADLENLLDHYAPTQGMGPENPAGSEGRESQIPAEMLASMVAQFVRHGQGQMPAAELNELQQSMPNWTERYWNNFSETTRELIARRLTGRLEEPQFWEAFHKRRT